MRKQRVVKFFLSFILISILMGGIFLFSGYSSTPKSNIRSSSQTLRMVDAESLISEAHKEQITKSNAIGSQKVFSQYKLFSYLSIEENRQNVLKRALQLNNGKYYNACVYFVAEALRQNGVDIPNTTCNTTGLTAQLKNKGWTRSSNYKNLLPGDICFTMDQNNGIGAPAHTYVFMAWVSPGKYDYAMVCDNQADRYGTVYHRRNISKVDVYKGEEKEPIQYFMRKMR